MIFLQCLFSIVMCVCYSISILKVITSDKIEDWLYWLISGVASFGLSIIAFLLGSIQ